MEDAEPKNLSGSGEMPGKQGAQHPAQPWHRVRAIPPAGNQPSVILEKCQFAKPPATHLQRQPAKLRVPPQLVFGQAWASRQERGAPGAASSPSQLLPRLSRQLESWEHTRNR